jgi:hypothetical protein
LENLESIFETICTMDMDLMNRKIYDEDMIWNDLLGFGFIRFLVNILGA